MRIEDALALSDAPQGPIDLALPSLGSGVVRSRVVATTSSALVITKVNTQSTGSEIVTVPIECQ